MERRILGMERHRRLNPWDILVYTCISGSFLLFVGGNSADDFAEHLVMNIVVTLDG